MVVTVTVIVSLCHCVCSQDSGTRKAALLVQYVDVHNEFVLEKKGKHGAKYLEMFQVFRWATQQQPCPVWFSIPP